MSRTRPNAGTGGHPRRLFRPTAIAARTNAPVRVCSRQFAASASAGPWQGGSTIDRAEALRVFTRRVEAYAALHRRLERLLPPLTPTRETLKNYVARQMMANEIRKARAGARQGDIFEPRVADVFRAIVADALKGRDVEAFLAEINEEHPDTHGLRAVVNEPLPKGTTHEVPCVLLQVLPVLPEEVEYRIVNHDLVLWDVHANLVVDSVPKAFVGAETTTLRHR